MARGRGQSQRLVRRANDLFVVLDYADAISRIGKRSEHPYELFGVLTVKADRWLIRAKRVSVREEPRQAVKLTLWVSPPLRLRAERSRVSSLNQPPEDIPTGLYVFDGKVVLRFPDKGTREIFESKSSTGRAYRSGKVKDFHFQKREVAFSLEPAQSGHSE